MKFIEKYYEEDKFRLKPYGSWCPYQLGYEEIPKEKGKCPEAAKNCSCKECWNREMPTVIKPESNNANLFPGFEINDVVQLRSGKLCIILPNYRSKDNKSLCYIYDAEPDRGSGISCFTYCCDYTDNLYKENGPNDIVKLWRSTTKVALSLIGYFFNKNKIPEFIKPIWIEQSAKKMTLKEIEKELGYQIEIISKPDRKEDKS